MDRNRIIAWACGLFAALLVIMAGKSCYGSIDTRTKKSEDTSAAEGFDIKHPDIHTTVPEATVAQYDMFGRPIEAVKTTEAPTDTTTEAPEDTQSQTEPEVEEDTIVIYTNANGEFTIPHYNTQTEPAGSQDPTLPEGFGGFHETPTSAAASEASGEPASINRENPTLPPDFAIVIN